MKNKLSKKRVAFQKKKACQANKSIVQEPFVTINTEEEAENMSVLKVSAKTRPNALAGAVANTVREEGRVEVQAR